MKRYTQLGSFSIRRISIRRTLSLTLTPIIGIRRIEIRRIERTPTALTFILGYNYDPTTIRLGRDIAYITISNRLRYDDATTHSTTTELIEIMICVRFNYNTTTRLRRKIDVNFFLVSNRVEWKQERAIRRSRIVVVS